MDDEVDGRVRLAKEEDTVRVRVRVRVRVLLPAF
jgi:hypothetical protein